MRKLWKIFMAINGSSAHSRKKYVVTAVRSGTYLMHPLLKAAAENSDEDSGVN